MSSIVLALPPVDVPQLDRRIETNELEAMNSKYSNMDSLPVGDVLHVSTLCTTCVSSTSPLHSRLLGWDGKELSIDAPLPR